MKNGYLEQNINLVSEPKVSGPMTIRPWLVKPLYKRVSAAKAADKNLALVVAGAE